MKVNWWKIGSIIVGILLIAVGAFFLGRKTMQNNIKETEIVYVETDPIHDTVYCPKPYKVVEPTDTADVIKKCVKDGKFYDLFPEKVKDSIVYVTKEDTAKIIKDWATERYYANVLFDDDTLGTCKYSALVQYNELTMLGYDYKPIQKITNTNTQIIKKYSPFIGGGISINSSIIGQTGLYIEDKYGVALQYQYNIERKENDYSLLVLYKF